MKKKLEIELMKIWDRGLAMRVLHQDESLRGKGVLYERGGMRIESVTQPEIRRNTLYVRGKAHSFDSEVAARGYASQTERDEMHDFILKAIEYINRPEPLTFERLRKEAVPGVTILKDENGTLRTFVGFFRDTVFAVSSLGSACQWREEEIKNWKIVENTKEETR